MWMCTFVFVLSLRTTIWTESFPTEALMEERKTRWFDELEQWRARSGLAATGSGVMCGPK